MGRFVAVFTVLLVIAAGCSASDGDPALDAAGDGAPVGVDVSSVLDEVTVAAIEGFIELLGPEEAFRGVLFAFDNGYEVGQVTAGMGDGSLDGNGVIAGVEPAGATVGLIDRSGPSAHSAVIIAAGPVIVAGASPVTAEEFKRGILDEAASMFLGVDLAAERERRELSEEASRALIATTVALHGAGYTMEQVIDFVVFGENAVEILTPFTGRCWLIVDAKQRGVVPANEPPVGTCRTFYEAVRERNRFEEGTTGTDSSPTTAQTDATAPSTAGSVVGVVFDVDTGDGIPGAVVKIVPGGPDTVTDGDGLFTLGEVPVGAYTITVTADGFTDTTAQIDVASGETLDTTFALERDFQIAFPRTYMGDGTLTLSYTYATGSCTVDGQKLEVTLWEDGTVSGTWDYLNPVFSWNDLGDGTLGLECKGSDPSGPIAVPGIHTPPTPDSGGRGHVVTYWAASREFVRFEGEYTNDEMIINWRSEFADELRRFSGFVYYDYEFALTATDG